MPTPDHNTPDHSTTRHHQTTDQNTRHQRQHSDSQPALYRRIADQTLAILIQIITQLHPHTTSETIAGEVIAGEIITPTPSHTQLVSSRILDWLIPQEPVTDYTYRTRQLTGCAYHFLPHGWKTHYAHHLGLYPARLRRWVTHTPHLLPDHLVTAPGDPIVDGLPASMWNQLASLGAPIPKTALTPEVKRLIVVASKTQTRHPVREFADRLGITRSMLESWEAALADGNITALASPRRTGTLTRAQAQEIMHMQQQHQDKDRYIAELEDQLAQARRECDRLSKVVVERDRLAKAVDALGKAIKTMPDLPADSGAGKPPSPPTKPGTKPGSTPPKQPSSLP